MSEPNPARGRRRAFLVFFIVLLLAAAIGVFYWLHAREFESTDDAQIGAHLNPISARIDGNVLRVYVDDNAIVHAGDPLVDLDPRDYRVVLDQSVAQLEQARSMLIAQRPNVPITRFENTSNISSGEAELANAEASLAAAQHDYESSEARLVESRANSGRAQADLARYQMLIAKDEISKQEFDQIAATAKAQTATVNANEAAVQSAARLIDGRRAQVNQAKARLQQYEQTAPASVAIREAMVKSQRANAVSAQAQLEQAELRLGYCKIVAPAAGIVMKRSAELGAHISAGQQLFMIAQTSDIWVTANFKETQLRHMHPGQTAKVRVDAFGRTFEGVVESIGGSTGSIASVLPPENATGNYVKVVQRVPVRIRFQPNQRGLEQLRPGLSVEPSVHIEP